MMTIRRAVAGDLDAVSVILRSAADWLHARGYDQWPEGSPNLGPDRLGAQIGRGEFWLLSEGGQPVACVAISQNGDADFWTPAELAEPAAYLSKLAVDRARAGRGLGEAVLRWACDHAAAMGMRWVRLDVWRTNIDLQAYYRDRGWEHLRTEEVPGRRSGAIFQRPAIPDPEAAAAFAAEGPLRVDRSCGIVPAGWETGEGGPTPWTVTTD
jgi:ribosomal protein S18 acetylase RimI-like enzyme